MSGGAMVAGAALGMFTDEYNRQSNFHNSLRYDQITRERQERSARRMTKDAIDINNKMAAETQQAKIDALKQSGLNVGLTYGGGGGAGGSTISMQGAQGDQPQGQPNNTMQGAAMGLEAMMIEANIELAKSQARKNNADADVTETTGKGEALSRIELNKQGVNNGKAKEALDKASTIMQDLENKKLEGTLEEQMQEIRWIAQKAMYEVGIAGSEDYVAYKTREANIQIIERTAVGKALENTLIEQKTAESKAVIKKMAEDIAQGWTKLDIEAKRAKIQQYAEELKAYQPNIMNVFGGKLNELIRDIDDLLNQNNPNYKKP